MCRYRQSGHLDIAAAAFLSASVRVVFGQVVIAASAFLSAATAAAVAGPPICFGILVPTGGGGTKSPPVLPLICAEGD
jgi:hypothetical protein